MQWKQKAQLMRVFEGQEGKFGADVKVADRAVDVKAEWERLQKDKKEGIKVL